MTQRNRIAIYDAGGYIGKLIHEALTSWDFHFASEE